MKKLITLTFCVFFSINLWGQDVHNKKLHLSTNQNKIPYNLTPSTIFPVIDPFIGDTIAYSDYYYLLGSIIRKRIVYFEGPHIAINIRPLPGNPAEHRIVYIKVEDDFYRHIIPFEEGLAVLPYIDVKLTGSNIGTIGISDGISRLALIDGDVITIKQTPENLYQSFIFSGDNIFLFNIVHNWQGYIYKSTDGGDNFVVVDSLSSFPIHSTTTNMDIDMFKSPNEQYIGILGTAEGQPLGGAHVYSGTPPEQADNLWLMYSTDSGNSWNGKSIGYDGLINSVQGYHTPNFAPLFENFGQVSGAVGDDGVFHVVANGYGLVFDDEIGSNHIGSAFPVLYWNSQSEEWISISNIAIDTIQAITSYYPGNALGQSFPQIAIASEQGILNVLWTAPQVEDGQLVVSNEVYYTDLNHAYSFNNGETWYNFYGALVSKPDVSEMFGVQANHIRTSNSQEMIVDIVYLEDISPDNYNSLNPIIYKTAVVPPGPLSVDDKDVLLNDFVLYQNYPNPFNPSTSITFFLPEASQVRLNIYNVIGEKLTTLVSDYISPGNHTIDFNADDLPSGIYFYQLQLGQIIQTKKMILLK